MAPSEAAGDWPVQVTGAGPVVVVRQARERDQAADLRDEVATLRDQAAGLRDEIARLRDEAAGLRGEELFVGEGRRGQQPDTATSADQDGDARDRAGDRRGRAQALLDEAGANRDRAGTARDEAGDVRDEAGDARDKAAERRDRAADRRDRAAEHSETSPATDSLPEALDRARVARLAAASDRRRSGQDRLALAAHRTHAGQDRTESSTDRGRSAGERTHADLDRDLSAADRQASAGERLHARDDRDQSSADRDESSSDRGASAKEREAASLDALTGAYLRAAGVTELERDIARTRRSGQPLALAFVDVDGLKVVNDTGGHAAGDRLLVEVASALRTHVRPYDLIIRFGGDEFVCAFAGLDLAAASARMAMINAALADAPESGSVTVGLAELEAQESLESLVGRADDALYQQRRQRGPTTPAG